MSESSLITQRRASRRPHGSCGIIIAAPIISPLSSSPGLEHPIPRAPILRSTVIVGLIATALAPAAPASASLRFAVVPMLGGLSGYTQYDQRIVYSGPDGTEELRSLLKFPLDVPLSGARVAVSTDRSDGRNLALSLKYVTNLDDPGDPMTDSDWHNDVLFSYTESEALMTARLFAVEASWTVQRSAKGSLDLIGGYRYQELSQELIGFEGFQRPFLVLGDFYPAVPVSDSRRALVYEITTQMPQIGFAPSLRLGRRVGAELRTLVGVMHVSDVDDHVLRNRLATASGTGFAIEAALRLRYSLGGTARRAFIDLSAGVARLHADVDQTQEWYGNDPVDDVYDGQGRRTQVVDNTGDVVTGIPHEISSTQHTIGLGLGVGF